MSKGGKSAEVTPRRWFVVATSDMLSFSISYQHGDTEAEASRKAEEKNGHRQSLAIELKPSDLRLIMSQTEAWYRQEMGEGS